MRRFFAIAALVALIGMAGVPGCIVDSGSSGCNGVGTLSITNSSISTEQAIQIDGIGYGNIFPGETVQIELQAGTHTVSTPGVAGGFGCLPVAVDVFECETQFYSCGA